MSNRCGSRAALIGSKSWWSCCSYSRRSNRTIPVKPAAWTLRQDRMSDEGPWAILPGTRKSVHSETRGLTIGNMLMDRGMMTGSGVERIYEMIGRQMQDYHRCSGWRQSSPCSLPFPLWSSRGENCTKSVWLHTWMGWFRPQDSPLCLVDLPGE